MWAVPFFMKLRVTVYIDPSSKQIYIGI